MENNIGKMIEGLRELRGANVHIFGQPVTLDENFNNEIIVDTVEVLEELEHYEVDVQEYEHKYDDERYQEWIDEGEVGDEPALIKFDSVDEVISHLDDIKDIDWDEYDGGNSYNNGGYFSHELDWKIYENQSTGGILVEIKAHRYGDVRGNYTESALLEFDDVYEFDDIMYQAVYQDVEVDGRIYSVGVSGMNDEVSLYDVENDEDFGVTYGDMQDVIEAIREGNE